MPLGMAARPEAPCDAGFKPVNMEAWDGGVVVAEATRLEKTVPSVLNFRLRKGEVS